MRWIGVVGLTVAALALSGPGHGAKCYDVSKGEPAALSGLLQYIVFPGPPDFEDIHQGDEPEPTYVLKLDRAICVTGDNNADPAQMITQVHLVGDPATWPALRSNIRHRVTVTLTHPMSAFTGHHHEPLVAFVTAVRPETKARR